LTIVLQYRLHSCSSTTVRVVRAREELELELELKGEEEEEEEEEKEEAAVWYELVRK
jgi:hypothetical protein